MVKRHEKQKRLLAVPPITQPVEQKKSNPTQTITKGRGGREKQQAARTKTREAERCKKETKPRDARKQNCEMQEIKAKT